MQNRLSKSERDAVLKRYKNDEPLFKLMKLVGRKYERELKVFRFAVEELFLEVMTIVDDAKESVSEAREEYADLWNTLHCQYRDLCVGNADEDEFSIAVAEVMSIATILLSMCKEKGHTHLSLLFINQMNAYRANAYEQMLQEVMPVVYDIGEEKLKTRIREYMESEEWISDDIQKMLMDLPDEPLRQLEQEEPTSTNDQLTNRQLALLFTHILDVGHTSDVVNVKALSKLMSCVSGRSSGSIRQTLMKMKEIDYNDSLVHQDLERIEALVRPISSKIADFIKNSKE
ncbi:MAG: hypothetical protein J6S02_09425 [Bacteroidaceae bacterium]|nr:hypothetical protein [Bacteroidaceae bacterium]